MPPLSPPESCERLAQQLSPQQAVIVNNVIAAMSQTVTTFEAAYQVFEDSELFSFEEYEAICIALGLA